MIIEHKEVIFFIFLVIVVMSGGFLWISCSDDESSKPIPDGPYLFVASGNAGIHFVSISDPRNPLFATTFRVDGGDTEISAYNIAYRQNHILVTQGSNGLSIIDVSDVNALERVGGYSTSGSYYGISVYGEFAYISDFNNEIVIMDISYPALPYPWAIIEVESAPLDSFVAGTKLYAALGQGGLAIFDISQSDEPVLLSQLATQDDASSVAVNGNYAYVTIMKRGMVIVDISDPAHPVEMGTQDTPGTALDLVLINNFACIADGVAGVQFINCQDPSNPQIVASYSPGPALLDVLIVGTIMYCAAGDAGLVVLDISDPTVPILLKTLDLEGYSMNIAYE